MSDKPADPEYQTYSMRDYQAGGDLLLAQIDYLAEMFDLEAQNENGKPIVITLREKAEHFTDRQETEAAEAFAERAWRGNS